MSKALGGVGLTVALFVANEAFVQPEMQGQAQNGKGKSAHYSTTEP